MTGTIQQVSVSPGGVPKRAVATGTVRFRGLDGDSWAHPQYHGGPDQAILLISGEVLERLQGQGFPLFPGALGENFTTRGLDARRWRAGQVYRAGACRIEMTNVRVPCNAIKVYGDGIGKAIYDARVKRGDFASDVWGYSGMYARVLEEGVVRAGDRIELVSEVA